MNFIIRYAIVAMSAEPMGGHDKTLEELADKDKAIEKAKSLSAARDNICVEKRRYASERNLQKGITFDQSVCWACWL